MKTNELTIYDNDACAYDFSDADMERMTRSLAPLVCDIYGWEMAVA